MEVLVYVLYALMHSRGLCGLPALAESHVPVRGASTEDVPIVAAISTHPTADEGRSIAGRKILRKIHNGLTFLAGVKVGSLLASKGFDPGHGTLAATHSFKVFGKSVNSAVSLSYGSGALSQRLPLVDDAPINLTETKTGDVDVVHLTVLRNPSPEIVNGLERIATVSVAGETGNGTIVNADDLRGPPGEKDPTMSNEFLKEHNARVTEFNREIEKRRNSKF